MNQITSKRRNWTVEERKILSEMFADNYTEVLCTLLNRSYSSVSNEAGKMGLKKSDAFLKMELGKQAEKLKISGRAYRFNKEHVPFNKGKILPDDVYQKLKPTMFKSGQIPHNSYPDWHEVLRKDKTGREYWMIKLPGERKLKPKHIWLWQTHHGKVLIGFNVIFKDKNSLNCVIENLECISNADLMKLNSIHRFPEELKSTIKLVHKLKRKISEKQN